MVTGLLNLLSRLIPQCFYRAADHILDSTYDAMGYLNERVKDHHRDSLTNPTKHRLTYHASPRRL